MWGCCSGAAIIRLQPLYHRGYSCQQQVVIAPISICRIGHSPTFRMWTSSSSRHHQIWDSV